MVINRAYFVTICFQNGLLHIHTALKIKSLHVCCQPINLLLDFECIGITNNASAFTFDLYFYVCTIA